MQTAKYLMSRDVRIISPDETIKAAAQQMLNGNFERGLVSNRSVAAVASRRLACRELQQIHLTPPPQGSARQRPRLADRYAIRSS